MLEESLYRVPPDRCLVLFQNESDCVHLKIASKIEPHASKFILGLRNIFVSMDRGFPFVLNSGAGLSIVAD
jgi:hypothetical protein